MIPELFLRDLSLWSCVWQSTLFAVFGIAGSFLLRRRPARASQVLFLAIIAAVLLPAMSVLVRHYGLGLLAEKPIVLPLLEIEIPTQTPEILSAPEILPAVVEAPTNFALARNNSWNIEIPWRSIVQYGWMTATLFLLGRLIIAFISGIRLLRRADSGRCEHIRPAADSARAGLGITKDLRIRSSSNVRSPMIWCWSNPPVLLVPDDLDGRIDWVGVISHELAHWMRWDHMSGLIAELAVCILPWNPLLWWSKKRMVRLSEQACDDWVLAGGRAGADYAQSLLNLSPELQMAFMPTVIGKEKPMKKRIYRIVKEKCGIPQVGVRWAIVVTMIAATLTVGVALAQRRPAILETRQRDEMMDAERQERRVLEELRGDLENRARQSRERLADVRAELAELEQSGRADSDKGHELRSELRDLEREIARIEREFRRAERDRPDREMRPMQERSPRQEVLRRLEELGHETEMELQALAEQNSGRNDQTNMLYGRMRELNRQMQEIRQQLGQRLERPGLQRMEFGRRELSEQKMIHMEELRERARRIELEIKELGDKNPERVEELHAELREIHESLAQIERDAASLRDRENVRQPYQREPEIPVRIRRRDEVPVQPGDEMHRRELMAQREQLRAQIKEQELMLEELMNDRAQAESERTQMLRGNLYDLSVQLKGTEKEIRESRPGPEQQRGREVQSLREQINGMNEQMGEMRELIKRLLENKQSQ